MWDAKADGYARGEGIVSVVLKRLSDAVADGDPLEYVVRATCVNQDGRTLGFTMSSGKAQLWLIRSAY
jgi:acyl transferase domain-containing protein